MLTQEGMNTVLASVSGENNAEKLRNYGDKLSNFMRISYYDNGGTKYGTNGSQAKVTTYTGGANVLGMLMMIYPQIINNGVKFLSKDGCLYTILILQNAVRNGDSPHNTQIGYVAIDINGLSNPNVLGKDLFLFTLFNDGSLRAIGASGWYQPTADALNRQYNWLDGTADKCNEDTVTSGVTCAGSIFENNLKVIYQ